MNRTRRSIGTSPKHLTQSLLQQKMWTDLVATANRGGWKLHHQQTNDSELIEAAWREQGRRQVRGKITCRFAIGPFGRISHFLFVFK